MFRITLMLVVMLLPKVGLGQTVTSDLPPPPLVQVPPPTPPSEPSSGQFQGTPPPPSMVPGPGYAPGQQGKSGYSYSPYGQPRSQEKPGPEVGLMVSESLFGALTAAGVTVLPYFLLFANGTLADPTVSSIIFCVIFGAAPLAVAQTQTSLANGSRHYQSEMWIPALTGLAGQALVLGIFYATGWLPTPQFSGAAPQSGSVAWLMIGSIGLVPVLQMVAINLFKQPKFPAYMTLGDPNRGMGIAFAPPVAAPIFSLGTRNSSLGVQLSFLRGNF